MAVNARRRIVHVGNGGLNSAEINGRTDFDVITVDNIEQFITACEKGVGATVLKGFVSQDPIDMGMTAMELAVAAAKGEDTGEYLHATAISLVTPENVDDFMSNYQKMKSTKQEGRTTSINLRMKF